MSMSMSMSEESSPASDSPVEALFRELNRPLMPTPLEALARLEMVAVRDTGQSRVVRYLLFLLVGVREPTGFEGEGLLELRALDRNLSDAYLLVAAWWRGPIKCDDSLYAVLRNVEMSTVDGTIR
jgi:hypothetical protein